MKFLFLMFVGIGIVCEKGKALACGLQASAFW